jgi:hypothetical protein
MFSYQIGDTEISNHILLSHQFFRICSAILPILARAYSVTLADANRVFLDLLFLVLVDA